MTEQFATQDARQAYLTASLVLVAEHRDRGVAAAWSPDSTGKLSTGVVVSKPRRS
ncbi:hypothetical protein ACWEQG_22975 [Microbispora sp. NPDC004025]